MKYSNIQSAAGLLMAGVCLITAETSRGVEFWLRAATVTNTMPDARQVVMWGFAQDSANWVVPGAVTVPGPQLNVAAGDSLVIHVTNSLPEPVSVVVPGLYTYDTLDATFHSGGVSDGRVRSLTHEAAANGGTATYTWTSVTNGTYLYHSGSHPSVQVQMGLYGALAARAAGPQAYAGVPFSSSVTLLFSEIDPEVHDAVSSGGFGPGPAFVAGDFTDASANTWINAINGASSSDPVAALIADYLTSGNTAAALVADLNTLVGGSSIYDPDAFPDDILSAATIDLLLQAPEVNQPVVNVPFNGTMVRLNRLLLQDGLAAGGLPALPLVNLMTSAIRSYPQYFLVNGTPYTNGTLPVVAGTAGSTILVSMLNAGMDTHVPTLNNGGDLQLIGEDGQQSPYPRSSAVVWLPALKTTDALWIPASAGTYAVYDRRLGLVNGLLPGGGMLAYLQVGAPVASTPPLILIPPASQTVPEFSTATFRVVASGSGLTYQWRRNSANIAGATAATYSRPNVTIAADSGSLFSVVVSGTGGSPVTSADATLTVLSAAPQITTQPATHNVTPPAATSFSVVATGSPTLTYQWSKGPTANGPFTPLANGTHISGATTSTLNLLTPTTASDAGFYQVVVTGPGGSATSVAAELRTPPGIITQPANQVVQVTHAATFSVVAAGTPPLTYQWQRRPGTTGTFTSIAGATDSSYTLPHALTSDNNAQFHVVVSGPLTPAATSSAATLTVNTVSTPVFIVQQPASLMLNSGTAASFTVVAYGYPNPTYQWQRLNGTTWQNMTGTLATGFTGMTTATLSVTAANMNVARAGSFRVIVSNSAGASVTSSVATLTVIQSFAALGALLPQAGTAVPYGTGAATSASVPAFTGAFVQHVTVNFTSFSFPEPYDVTAMLATPSSVASLRKVEFMAGVGAFPSEYETPAPGGVYSYPVRNIGLTFDDAAPAPISSYYPLTAGTYKPTVTTPVAAFPAPAPGLPYGTALSTFNGFNQTSAGGWRLYLNDVPTDIPITSGGLLLGWNITLTVGPNIVNPNVMVISQQPVAPPTVGPAAPVKSLSPASTLAPMMAQ